MARHIACAMQNNIKPSPPLTNHFFCQDNKETGNLELFQSITTVPEYSFQSFEEVRLQDYAEGRGPPPRAAARSTTFNTPSPAVLTPSSSGDVVAESSSTPPGSRGLLPIVISKPGVPPAHPSLEFRSPLLTTSASDGNSNPFQSRIITIRVGANPTRQQDFSIHEGLLTRRRSPVIQALLSEGHGEHKGKGKGKEVAVEGDKGKDVMISLPFETKPEVFAIYQQYLYTNLIHIPLHSPRPFQLSSSQRAEDTKAEAETDASQTLHLYTTLLHSYTLGLALEDSVFQNAVIDSLIHTLRSTALFPVQLTRFVWENTPRPSFLRNLWMDVFLWCREPSWGEAVEASFMRREQSKRDEESADVERDEQAQTDDDLVNEDAEARVPDVEAEDEGRALYAEFSRDLDAAYDLTVQYGSDPPFLREVGCWYHGHMGEVCEGWLRMQGAGSGKNGMGFGGGGG